MLTVGSRAPDFTLPDQDGTPTSLREIVERGPAVLYFYPKDETPGCTAEACSFRDSYTAFTDAGAQVIGVSSDSVESHRAFADHHRLPFRLLSDRGGVLRGQFGVPKTLGLLDGRVTFVIDRSGQICHVFSSQLRARKHIAEALAVVQRLAGRE